MINSLLCRSSKVVIVLTLLLFSFGCSHYYVPKQYPIKSGMAPDFTSDSAISVTNDQTPGKIALFYTQGFHKYLGDLHLWTNTAIGVLENELNMRKIPVRADAEKELKLSITHANGYQGFASLRCIITLRVETGEGYTKEFEGNNTSPWTLYRACDGAVTRAVEAMLNDEEILRYIKY